MKNKFKLLSIVKEMSEVKKRLNYIGSKFQLLDWITIQISEYLQIDTTFLYS